MLFFNNFWNIAGGVFWAFALIACLIGLVLIIPDLFRDQNMSGWAKALWILLLIFLPFVGVLAYLIARGKAIAERHSAHAEKDLEASDEYFGAGGASPAGQIVQAREMLESGAITQADYDRLKESGMA
jgi:hypothetical protein